MKLGLCVKDLKPCEGGNLLAFIDSSTHPCGTIDISILSGEGKNKRIMKVCFLIIPCESISNEIIGRLFLVIKDAVTSTTHLKMKYNK